MGDAKMVGHEMMANTGHIQEDAKMVGHEMRETAGDYKVDIENRFLKKRKSGREMKFH